MTTFTVSTVTDTSERITTTEVGTYTDKVKAMIVARNAAGGRIAKYGGNYGPSAFCYVGPEVTAVVAW